MRYNPNYCLLCDKILEHGASALHNKHRCENKYWKYILFYNDRGEEVLKIFNQRSNDIEYPNTFYINWKNCSNLFKKAETLEKAQAIVNKLKVFK